MADARRISDSEPGQHSGDLMRRIFAALVLLVFQLGFASAQDQWREFRFAADGFVVSLPQEPTVTSRRIKDTKATQSMFLIEKGELAYLVSVIHMEKGTGPKNPDQKYFQNLIKNYAEGSTTTVRTSKLATIAGKPGIDGISDTANSAHQVQILVAGDRVYMVIYVGPKGQENSADAVRFRNSFKLIK
jgi:hypothetical protein